MCIRDRGTDPASVEARRLDHARRAAAELGATVLLKGSTTLIAQPGDPTVLVNPTGTPWLATAGSGDVLTGLAARLAAAGGPDGTAEAPIGASDVVRALPGAFRSL